MRPRIFLTAAGVLLAALAWADDPTPSTDQVRMFRQNQALIETLVDGGLHLAELNEPLQRADFCTELAEKFSGEIQRAAQDRDNARADELRGHFHDLIQRGVTANLETAKSKIQMGTSQEQELLRVRERAQLLERTLEPAARAGPAASNGDFNVHVVP
jgi:hypothetical protein